MIRKITITEIDEPGVKKYRIEIDSGRSYVENYKEYAALPFPELTATYLLRQWFRGQDPCSLEEQRIAEEE